MISAEDKERVRQQTDFLQLVGETVELRRRGADWWGCCPFHHEKSPSFHINPSTGLWKCFGCGLGGDVFDYVMHREHLEFPDAIRFLADRAGIELVEERGARSGPKRNRLIACLTEAEQYYSLMLNRGRGRGPAQGRGYLSERGYNSAVCRRWGLGYAPGYGMLCAHLESKGFTREEMETADLAVMRNGRPADRFYDRVMFPIHDEQGRTIAFGGRVLTDAKPKYLNTKETPVFHKGKHLFGFDRAKEHIVARKMAIVCEGYTDVIALHEAGYPIAVAALGTSFSLDHVRSLARFAKVIICMFDGDAAGQRAADRAIQFLDKTEADLRCVVLPDGMDPAEYLAAHNPAELQPLLDNARPLMSFVIENRLANVGPSSPAGVRAAALDNLATVLAPLKDSYVFEAYALDVADRLGFDVGDVKRVIREKPVQGVTNVAEEPWSGHRSNGWVDDMPPVSAYEGQAQPTVESGPLSHDERTQLQAECELLSLLATNPDLVKTSGDRIATFVWSDPRHEAMAWAMLATPTGASPHEVVQAAESVVPEAAQILSSGRVASSSDIGDEEKVRFVLDAVELYSIRRQIREIRAQMRNAPGDASELFQRATQLQQRSNVLARRLSGSNN